MSRLLADTHVILWWLADDARLSSPARLALSDSSTAPLVSAASLWEIAIKLALGKLRAPADLPTQILESGFGILPVSGEHAWAVRELPPHHGDPFDRLLVAQAKVEQLPITTRDQRFGQYGVAVVW